MTGRLTARPAAHGQRGYALLIVLVALAIVAFLARDSISRWFGTMTQGASQAGTRGRATQPPAADATAATPPPGAAIERARAVEDVVRQQAEQAGKRIDAAQ